MTKAFRLKCKLIEVDIIDTDVLFCGEVDILSIQYDTHVKIFLSLLLLKETNSIISIFVLLP